MRLGSLALLALLLFSCTRPEAARCTGDDDCLNGFSCQEGTCMREPDSGTVTDADDAAMPDTSVADAGSVDAPPVDPVDAPSVDAGTEVSGDWSCIGLRTGAGTGMTTTAALDVRTITMDTASFTDLRAGLGVRDVASCAMCTGPMFSFSQGALFSAFARVTASGDTMATRWVGSPWIPSSATFTLPGVARSDVRASAMALGVTDSSLLAGIATVVDCARQPASGADIEILLSDGSSVSGLIPTAYGGTADATVTDDSGVVFMAVGATGLGLVGGVVGTLTLEAWGTLGGERVRLACEDFPIETDALTIVELGPLRSDYETGSGCL